MNKSKTQFFLCVCGEGGIVKSHSTLPTVKLVVIGQKHDDANCKWW